MSDAECRLFYNPLSPILSAENRSTTGTLVLAKSGLDCTKYSIFPKFPPNLPMENGHYCVSLTTTTTQPAIHCHNVSHFYDHFISNNFIMTFSR